MTSAATWIVLLCNLCFAVADAVWDSGEQNWAMITFKVENLSGLQAKISLYVNGEYLGGNQKECVMSEFTTTFNTYLGYTGNAPSGYIYFDGKIDDVRIFNKVLEPNEVWQLYYNVEGAQGQYFLAGNN
jgi:hypothetical protein